MLVLIMDTAEEGSRLAADLVAHAVEKNPELRLGLAAGDTQIALYRNLVDLHRSQRIDLSHVRLFGLDEFIGLPKHSPHSYHSFYRRHLVEPIKIHDTQLYFLSGETEKELSSYCASYENLIREQGGIALQILGIGQNGHLGFNEPGSSLNSRTRLSLLTKSTRVSLAHAFVNSEVPQWAITMGLATIREARGLLLLAFGKRKANAVAKALEGPLSGSLPASSIQLHATVIVVLDREASSLLTNHEFYREQAHELSSLLPEWLR